MAIIGIGLDVVELDRVRRIWQRFGETFTRRILTPGEFLEMPDHPVPFLAARFAAKEAAVKALGTGFAGGIGPRQVQVLSRFTGRPRLTLLGKADCLARELGVNGVHLSLTHGRHTAAAMVVLER